VHASYTLRLPRLEPSINDAQESRNCACAQASRLDQSPSHHHLASPPPSTPNTNAHSASSSTMPAEDYEDDYDEQPDSLATIDEELKGYLSDGPTDWVEPVYEPDYSTAIVVDNLPKVPQDKYERLLAFVRKIYEQVGRLAEDGLQMPVDEATGMTQGFAFVNFLARDSAEKAIAATNNWNFDKAHAIKVNSYVDLVRTTIHPETYTPEPARPLTTVPGLYTWLKDAQFRDQFVVRHGRDTEVYWAEAGGTPELVYGGEREKAAGQGRFWCDQYVAWSKTGAYLLTYHRQGIALWGGPNFEKVARLAHHGVALAHFSNTDRYLVTYSYPQAPGDGPGHVVVWDVERSISVQQQVALRSWPVEPYGKGNYFKWSHDDKFIAVGKSKYLRNPQAAQAAMDESAGGGAGGPPGHQKQQASTGSAGGDMGGEDAEGQISVFEAPSMELLDRKSIRAEGLRGFDWCPKANLLAYWAPEKQQQPARVVLVEVPSKKEVRRKPLFHVEDCELTWQNEGEYLCAKVTHKKRQSKKKVSLELFRIKEAGIALEMVELDPTPVRDFAWEPAGHRFAIIHGEDAHRFTVSFYSMLQPTTGQKEVTLLHRLEGPKARTVNKLLWSPNGSIIVLANLSEGSGLEFYDVDTQSTLAKREDLSRIDYLKWDPSGRYLTDAIQQPMGNSYYKYSYDNGFRVWTFQGTLIAHVEKAQFYMFQWRPRPPSLLTAEQQRKVKKDLRKYERRFDKEDREKEMNKKREEWRKKGARRAEFRAFNARRMAERSARKEELIALQKGYDDDDPENYEERVVTRRMVPLGERELVGQ